MEKRRAATGNSTAAGAVGRAPKKMPSTRSLGAGEKVSEEGESSPAAGDGTQVQVQVQGLAGEGEQSPAVTTSTSTSTTVPTAEGSDSTANTPTLAEQVTTLQQEVASLQFSMAQVQALLGLVVASEAHQHNLQMLMNPSSSFSSSSTGGSSSGQNLSPSDCTGAPFFSLSQAKQEHAARKTFSSGFVWKHYLPSEESEGRQGKRGRPKRSATISHDSTSGVMSSFAMNTPYASCNHLPAEEGLDAEGASGEEEASEVVAPNATDFHAFKQIKFTQFQEKNPSSVRPPAPSSPPSSSSGGRLIHSVVATRDSDMISSGKRNVEPKSAGAPPRKRTKV